jgi:hypothetical protein
VTRSLFCVLLTPTWQNRSLTIDSRLVIDVLLQHKLQRSSPDNSDLVMSLIAR